LKDLTKGSSDKLKALTPQTPQTNNIMNKNSKSVAGTPFTNQNQPNRTYSTPSSANPVIAQHQFPQANMATIPAEVNSLSKQQAYARLIVYPGIIREELLFVLSQFSPYDTVKVDSVTMRIAAHRQVIIVHTCQFFI